MSASGFSCGGVEPAQGQGNANCASGVYVGSLESAGEIIGAVMVFEEQLAAHDGPLVGVWGYYIYDPAENIALFASRALYDLFGIDEGRLHFSYIHESLVVAADLAALTTALHAALETDSIQLARYRIKRPDGRELSLCSRFNALREGNRALIAGVTWCEGEGP